MREASGVEDPVVSYAKQRGYMVRKCAWIGRRSAPDRLFSRRGVTPFWIEFKAPGKEPDALQAREIKRMREAGLTVHIIDNVEDGCALFD